MKPPSALLLCTAVLAVPAQAQTAVLNGVIGDKALLVIDGAAPRALAVGQSQQGVRLLSLQGDAAEVEVAGVRQTLRLGQAPLSTAPPPPSPEQSRIVLHAGSQGHFVAPGQINGRAVQFLVDTGASLISLSAADAQRIGLNYQNGRAVWMNTANGSAPGWLVKLDSVRLGSVEVYGVDAIVGAAPMPHVLLGNSYLTRFQMTRTNDQLVLERRY